LTVWTYCEDKSEKMYIKHVLQNFISPDIHIRGSLWNASVSNWREDDRKIRKLYQPNE